MSIALLAIDGVLRDAGGLPLRDGVVLYESLCLSYRVVLASSNPERDDLWLRAEGLRSHQEVVGIPPAFLRGTTGLRRAQAEALLGSGGAVSLVVDADPQVVLEATERGLVSVLYVHPKFSRPEWRPDRDQTPRPWDDLVAEIERQSALASTIKPVNE